MFAIPGQLESRSNLIVIAALIAFCVCSVSILFGCASGFMKHQDIAYIFGGCLLPVWILFFVSAYMCDAFTNSALMPVEEFCNKNKTPELLWNYVTNIDTDFHNLQNKWMCSKQCPCDMKQAAPWLDMTEAELNKWGRTKNLMDGNDADGTVLLLGTIIYGNDLDYFPASFEQCFLDWKSDWYTFGRLRGKAPLLWYQPAQNDFEKVVSQEFSFTFATYLEDEFDCSGICQPNVFYATREVEDKQPTQTCLPFVQDELKKVLPLQHIVFITALVSVGLWFVQYALWFRYTDDVKV